MSIQTWLPIWALSSHAPQSAQPGPTSSLSVPSRTIPCPLFRAPCPVLLTLSTPRGLPRQQEIYLPILSLPVLYPQPCATWEPFRFRSVVLCSALFRSAKGITGIDRQVFHFHASPLSSPSSPRPDSVHTSCMSVPLHSAPFRSIPIRSAPFVPPYSPSERAGPETGATALATITASASARTAIRPSFRSASLTLISRT
jgi:hypothetical protein